MGEGYLYHYTSLDAFVGMLGGERCEIKGNAIVLRATSIDFMNDGCEYALARNECASSVEEICSEVTLGLPFAICFSEKYDNIPMWNMYAKGGTGLCLKFNLKKLKDFFENELCCIFRECKYVNRIEVNEKPFYKNDKYDRTLNDRMKTAAFCKSESFSYEAEWRAMFWVPWHNPNTTVYYQNHNGYLRPYIETKIPIDCLEKIILGPCFIMRNLEPLRLLFSNRMKHNEKDFIEMSKTTLIN